MEIRRSIGEDCYLVPGNRFKDLKMRKRWEARFEPNKYGFRPGRGCHDAVKATFHATFIAINKTSKCGLFILIEVGMECCSDEMNRDKLFIIMIKLVYIRIIV